jgi:hypothetical protein
MATIPETQTTSTDVAPETSTPLKLGVVPPKSVQRPVIAFDRSLWLWVAICSVVMFAGVGGGVWAVTGRAIDGLAVAAFTTLWGGPGFGIMFGSAYHALSTERSDKRRAAEEAAATSH